MSLAKLGNFSAIISSAVSPPLATLLGLHRNALGSFVIVTRVSETLSNLSLSISFLLLRLDNSSYSSIFQGSLIPSSVPPFCC